MAPLSNIKQVFRLYWKNWVNGPCGRKFYTAYDAIRTDNKDPPDVDPDTEEIDARINEFKGKLDEKLAENLTNDEIAKAVRKYLRKIGGLLTFIDELEDEEEIPVVPVIVDDDTSGYMTAFEATDDESEPNDEESESSEDDESVGSGSNDEESD